MEILEGQLRADGYRFGIIVGRFNSFIGERLLEGALDALKRHGASEKDICIVRVPGAFEMPVALKRLLAARKLDAGICLGAVIRGSTPHFEYVSNEVTKGIASVSLDAGIPVAFGVLTTDTIEQAIERAGTKAGNKGFEAAVTAIEMVSLFEGMK